MEIYQIACAGEADEKRKLTVHTNVYAASYNIVKF